MTRDGGKLALDPHATALVIYDVTHALMVPGPAFEPWAAEGLPALAKLAAACRATGTLVVYANSARGYDTSGTPPDIAAQPGDEVVKHPESGAFFNTNLEEMLRANGRDTLLIAGMAVDRGANTTAREALARKLRPIVVSDVCFTRDIADSPVGPVPKHEVARVHLAALHRLGVGVTTVADAIAALGAPRL
jgi:nicotinamidase-related amidase